MIKLHPAIVHFPIALLISTAGFALLSFFTRKELFKEIVFWNLIIGVITAVISILTGLWDEHKLVHNEEIHELLQKHKFVGFSILIVFLALLTWFWKRKKRMRKTEYIAWFVCLIFGGGMLMYQGYVGGKIVLTLGQVLNQWSR